MGNSPKFETLVTTMHQKDESKYYEMNLKTDTVIANQADFTGLNELFINGCNVKLVSTTTRGIGANRNIGFIYSTGDIILFADDDMVFEENYDSVILDAFEENQKADAIIFNIESSNPDRPIHQRIKSKKAKFKDVTATGICGLAIKKEVVLRKNLCFSYLFGGGARYSCGEDTLFLKNLFDRGVKVYIRPDKIATVKQESSSWFKGINDKFFFDKGVLYYMLNHNMAKLYSIYHIMRHRKEYREYGLLKAIKQMLNGINYIRG